MAEEFDTIEGTLPSSAGVIMTNDAGEKSEVLSLVLTNNNSTDETVEIYQVPNSGGSVGTLNVDLHRKIPIALQPGEIFVYDKPFIQKGTNDTLQGVTTTASKVRFEINRIITT